MDNDLPIIFEHWLVLQGLIFNKVHSTIDQKVFIYMVPGSSDTITIITNWSNPAKLTVSIHSTAIESPTSDFLRRPQKESQAKTLLWLYGIKLFDLPEKENHDVLNKFIEVLKLKDFNNQTFGPNTYIRIFGEDNVGITIHNGKSIIVNGLNKAESWLLPIPKTEEQANTLLWLHGLEV